MRWARVVFVLILVWFILTVSKEKMSGVINNSMPYSEAGLLSGIILGDKSGLGRDFQKMLINSGLIHLVVVSGSNVMLLIGGVIESLASWVGRKWAIVLGLVMGWKYVMLVGWEVPVVRAMLLLSILYWAQLLGRKYNLVRGLGLAITIMIIGEPMVIVSVSFWLSITAFLGIVTGKLGIRNYELGIRRNKLKKIFFEISLIFLQTVWVNVWITPILALVFGNISLISPLTNMLVLGLVGVVSVVGAVGIILGLWWLALGKAILWLTIPSLTYLRRVAEFGGQNSGVQVEFNWWMLVGYYLILFYWLMKIETQVK
ncbi:ComEC/Rec2 family competence protein [Candidatus Shapirobacteria bacterium]|nr:ComEC/Rec2 family competence protein [Candidatus Shapirobacteria bacterium]